MRTNLFDYELPPERIAQTPLPRGQSRLLVLHRAKGKIEHRRFPDLIEYLHPGDTLVLNDTRVSARRLEALRENGQPAEVVLLRPFGPTGWEALVRRGRAAKPGRTLTLLGPPPKRPQIQARVTAATPEGGRILEFEDMATRDRLATWGVAPLPPYIHTPLPADQEERYQTVYATQEGSAAAPTAGLHFTPEMLAQAESRGVAIARITLHVGVDTFRPVSVEEIEAHEMHGEILTLDAQAAGIINATRGRVIAVGTTSVRTLETAAAAAAADDGRWTMDDGRAEKREQGRGNSGDFQSSVLSPQSSSHPSSLIPERVVPFSGETRLFITPGYRFRTVEALITNFHLPRSTLLMLVSAFAGRELVLQAYQEAITEDYRFFSFGDAMLIL